LKGTEQLQGREMEQTIIYSSPDGKYCVTLNSGVLKKLQQYALKSPRHETGGILTGYYADGNNAIIVDVSDKPHDSKFGATWFHRGVSGLKELLGKKWKKKEYYLGEWHSHPGGSVQPSSNDRSAMKDIANSPAYRCPKPVLVIIGGYNRLMEDISVHVMAEKQWIPLHRTHSWDP
jgi:integrative and conjugative element protein (TIGR02256 family)